jgi:hypothetical protein
MTRPSTYLVVFLLSVHAVAGLAATTGADDVMGVDAGAVQSEQLADESQSLKETQPSNTGGTLFGLIGTAADALYSLFTTISPGLKMLGNAGVPSAYINAFGLITTSVIGFDLISFYRGWGL